MKNFKSGFVGIVGPTNSGKSTLLNALLGKKISIVSPKVQTTYRPISGVLTQENSQSVFLDTPGFQNYPERVAHLLNGVADKRARECDTALWVFDASRKDIFKQVMRLKTKISQMKPQEVSYCVLNKVDKIDKAQLLPLIQSLWELGVFKEIVPISAKNGTGVDRLREIVIAELPTGEKYYPDEAQSDRPREFIISEFVREKIYLATREELPYSCWIEVEEWQEAEELGAKCPTIRAVIHVDSPSRKGILIGKGGEMLKRIGLNARKDIETFLGKQVCLKLHVDVQNRWRDDKRFLQQYLEL